MNWNELWKIRLNNYSEAFIKHEVVKLLIVSCLLNKYQSKKKYQEIYTEYPLGVGKTCDVFHRDLRTKEIRYYEIQKNLSDKYIKETTKIYEQLEGDLIIIDLNKLDDNLNILLKQIKELII